MSRRIATLVVTIAAIVLAACSSPTAPQECKPGVGLGSGQC
jgi:hypothetical protein